MSYSLSDLPIERVNRKKGILTVLAVMAAVDWLVTFVLLAAHNWSFGQVLAIRGFAALPAWGAFCMYGVFYFYRRHSKLLINSKGVQITVDGRSRYYAWTDIGQVKKTV